MVGTFTSISENDVSSLNTENSKIKVWNLEIKTKTIGKPLRQKRIAYSSLTRLGDLRRQMSHINDPHGKARRLILHRIDIHLLGILNISKLSQIAKSAAAPPTVAQLRAKINRLSLRDVRNTIFRKFIPDSFNVFRNNEPIILNPTTILEEYDQYWRPTDPHFVEEVEARRNLALNKTLFQEKNTLGLSQIAYAFLKDPLLKRIRTKNIGTSDTLRKL